MGTSEIKDRAAMVATEVTMIGDDIMQADRSVGKAESAMDRVLDAIGGGVSELKEMLKYCEDATAPLAFAHQSLQDKQQDLRRLGLHESKQEITRDVPKRLGTLVTRTGSYAYAAAELHRSANELSGQLNTMLERMNDLRRAFQETHTNTGGDVIEALQAYGDATEAFIQEY